MNVLDGHVMSFDIVKNTGVVLATNGKEYDFSASEILGNIPLLNDYPGVSITLKNGQLTQVKYNDAIERLKDAPRRGHALLGAAKCPNCEWRIPILPDAGMSKIRKGEYFDCPDCGVRLRLKSMFRGVHHYLAVGIWVVPAVIRYAVGRMSMFWDETTLSIIGFVSLVFYPIQILAFFYLYIQESLIIVSDEDDS